MIPAGAAPACRGVVITGLRRGPVVCDRSDTASPGVICDLRFSDFMPISFCTNLMLCSGWLWWLFTLIGICLMTVTSSMCFERCALTRSQHAPRLPDPW